MSRNVCDDDMEKYYVIVIDDDSNGNKVRMEMLDSEDISLDKLRELVDCKTIQIVRCMQFPSLDLLMCIDDNGKIWNKPVNDIATYLYGQFPQDFIVGKAVLGIRERRETQEPDMYAIPEHECKAYVTMLNLI